MGIKVTGLLHHGVRVGKKPEEVEAVRIFYEDILGLNSDEGRPDIRGVPGFWMNLDSTARQQIHLMGAEGPSPFAKSENEDPVSPHVALAVENVREAMRVLDEKEIPYFTFGNIVGNFQLFVRDPAGNMVELQEAAKE